ncbi:MAG: DnaJ C-terminal domain-containing protein [Otoolea sp.]
MGMKRDYYEVLGVNRNADDAAIKKAYRKLAKKYHPDSNAGNTQAEERFKEVTEAYDILSDPEKRKLYDRFGHAAFDGSAQGAAGGASGGPGGGFYRSAGPDGSYQEYHFEGGDMDDILKNLFGGGFGGFGDGSFHRAHSDFFGGGSGFSGGGSGFTGSRGGYAADGSDLEAEISVTFEEAVFGCDKVIHLGDNREVGGAGKALKVHIPAGIDTGKSIRLRGKGMPGSGGGRPGDLMLKVKVGEKAGFERKGMDIYTTVRVPFTTAVFGGEAMVQTLYGNVLCKIAEGTQSGTKIRLKGKGVVSMKEPGVYGDQYVTVQIEVPKNLNETAKRKLKEFEAACGGRGRSVA